MKGWVKIILVIGFLVFALNVVAFAKQDARGCKDHPLFTRMEDFYIYECKEVKWDEIDFRDEKGKYIKVEGKVYYYRYYIKEGITPGPSVLMILRNYENAIKKIGGVKVYQESFRNYLKLNKSGKTFWVKVETVSLANAYSLYIVEQEAMAQEVVADAKSMMSDIQTKGSAAVYGIYFDFDKADIKPESEPAIKEIAKLLQENRTLKLYVVGHTDNVGTIDYNLKLSKARADAVVKELTTKYKISPDRLRAFGVASLAPVASNKTEDGRAKNRRVELVEQ
ncbi:Major porin and structural outer membrane porin OprF [Thermodesulfovibrio sp. N1]|uniref:OmpA family protein n=1 Tax=Thermodesulfovibrio sp. N1 TaxID=1871110 RepID=UPI0008576916|nr:OmpA family protein [Thermodesulfovibrio sp. N1]ODA45202.1 Major porin and structural outer membrane porin OprF [Thermodesulfovibrio sp. N1]